MGFILYRAHGAVPPTPPISSGALGDGGIAFAPDGVAEAFCPGITKHKDFNDKTKAGYGSYVANGTIGNTTWTADFKFIGKFYWAPLFKGTGGAGNLLNDAELGELLPYVNVSVEQMKEAQRRAPRSCIVLAKTGAFANESEANAKGFILPAAFIDGGEEKSGFFISSSLTTQDGTGIQFGLSWTDGATENANHQLWRLYSTAPAGQSTVVNTIEGCSSTCKDAIYISQKASPKFQCESAYTVAALSLLSLACAQYATSTDECAWYDSNGVMNFPKGINSTDKDIDDNSVTIPTAMSQTAGSVFPADQTVYCKTTHNGKVYGITHVNGWLWRPFVGYGYVDNRYQLFDNSSNRISQITPDNCDTDTSMYHEITTAVGDAWSEETDTPLFVDKSGQGRQLNCLFSHSSGNASNLFGQDYHYRGTDSAGFVGGAWDHSSGAGVFGRSGSDWTGAGNAWGFRVVGY